MIKRHIRRFFYIFSNMNGIKKTVSTALTFVGSVVGAGFATGQEVSLFFGADGVWSLLVAALFTAVCAFAFMSMGAREVVGTPRLAADVVVGASSFAFYAAMIAAAEELLRSLTGQSGLSVLLAAGMIFLTGERTSYLALLNFLAVPLMAAILAMVGVRAGGRVEGGFHLFRALCYGGMNLLFSGALLAKEGKGTTTGQRLGASLLSGGLFFLTLFFMRRCVAGEVGDMPFLAAAERAGLLLPSRLCLLLAIVTTMASCAYLSTDRLSALVGDRVFAASFVALTGILTSKCGFAVIVNATYPVVSVLGLVATVGALTLPTVSLVKKRKGREYKKRTPKIGVRLSVGDKTAKRV